MYNDEIVIFDWDLRKRQNMPSIEISPSVVFAEKRTLLIINTVSQKALRVSVKHFVEPQKSEN